jgi:hypothetical protein
MELHPIWRGFGYLGVRKEVSAEERDAADARLLEYVNALRMTADEVFTWANSPAGRAYGELFGSDSDHPDDFLPLPDDLTRSGITPEYVSLAGLAQMIGVRRDTAKKYRLPDPDAYVDGRPVWLPSTVEEWNASRPRKPRVTRPLFGAVPSTRQ